MGTLAIIGLLFILLEPKFLYSNPVEGLGFRAGYTVTPKTVSG